MAPGWPCCMLLAQLWVFSVSRRQTFNRGLFLWLISPSICFQVNTLQNLRVLITYGARKDGSSRTDSRMSVVWFTNSNPRVMNSSLFAHWMSAVFWMRDKYQHTSLFAKEQEWVDPWDGALHSWPERNTCPACHEVSVYTIQSTSDILPSSFGLVVIAF